MKRALVLLAVISVGFFAWCQAPPHPANAAPTAQQKEKVSPFAGYAGVWTSKFDGKVWLLLKLDLHGEQLSGSLLHPQKIDLNDNGELKSVSEEQINEAVSEAVINPDGLLLTLKDPDTPEIHRYMMRLTAPDNESAELKMIAMTMPPGMPKPKPWRLTKSGAATTKAAAPR